jgi:hypothetical protein
MVRGDGGLPSNSKSTGGGTDFTGVIASDLLGTHLADGGDDVVNISRGHTFGHEELGGDVPHHQDLRRRGVGRCSMAIREDVNDLEDLEVDGNRTVREHEVTTA